MGNHPGNSHDRESWIKAFLLLGCSALIFVRVPAIFLQGRFWAEEGFIYFSKAFSSSAFDALFSVGQRVGYYSLVNSLSGLLASRLVSLENAPKVTAFIAFLIQLIPILLIVYGNIPGFRSLLAKAGASLLVLFMPPNHEIFLVSVNSQFHLSLAAGLILISQDSGTKMRAFKYGALLLAGLSGTLSLFLLPFYWIAGWIEKKPERLIQILILTLCAAIEGFIMISSLSSGERHFAMNGDIFLCAVFTKSLLLPWLGFDYTQPIALRIIETVRRGDLPLLPMAFTLGFILAFACLVFKSRKREAIFLFLAWLEILLLSFAGSVEAVTREKLALHISISAAERYYYVPNLFLYFSLFLAIQDWIKIKFWVRTFCAGLTLWILFLGAWDFFISSNKYPYFYKGPAWHEEVQKWKADHRYLIRLWPSPWRMRLEEPESHS